MPLELSSSCSVGDCGLAVKARGYCSRHYRRWQAGRPLETPFRVFDTSRRCSKLDCGKGYHALGLCKWHYDRRHTSQVLCLCGEKFWPVGGQKACFTCCPKGNAKARALMSVHHLAWPRYESMLESQKGLCAIPGCLREATVVDHSHDCCPGKGSCGKCVRALLCNFCNSGLGYIESPGFVQAARAYLGSHR